MKLNLPNLLRPDRPAQATVDGVPAPAALRVAASHVRVGDGYAATFAVCGYPAEVGPAWLDPLLSYPARVDVAIHVTPLAPQIAASMLKRQRARLESTRRLDADHGRLGDPMVEAAATDAADLADRVARGAAKLFDTGIYVTVHARDLDELATVSAGVRSAAASVLLDLEPATFRHQQGWVATLPVGVDPLRMRRILDTTALAAAFPLACADPAAPAPGQLAEPTGVLYGVNTTSAGVLMWNRWAQDNHNTVVLARSGAGKSYFVKLEVLRTLYQGVQVAVVDPEDEYTPLAEHVGGAVVQLGQPGVRINPLDLPARTQPDRHSAPARRAPAHPDVRDARRQRTATGRSASRTRRARPGHHRHLRRRRDHRRPRHLGPSGAAAARPARHAGRRPRPGRHRAVPAAGAVDAGQLRRPVRRRHQHQPEGHLVVWSLRHLPDELRTVGTLLALDSIWNSIDTPSPTVGSGSAGWSWSTRRGCSCATATVRRSCSGWPRPPASGPPG